MLSGSLGSKRGSNCHTGLLGKSENDSLIDQVSLKESIPQANKLRSLPIIKEICFSGNPVPIFENSIHVYLVFGVITYINKQGQSFLRD
jgi:hypothetical protein